MRNKYTIPEGYKKVIGIREKQEMLTLILKDFDRICEEEGLIYNIFGGTLLGAVRHGGFIPWDDDIDVTMPREDYESFLSLDVSSYGYEIRCFPNEGYAYPFAKLCLKNTVLIENNLRPEYNTGGLYIDIFPVDGYPDINREKSFFRKRMKLKRSRCLAVMAVNPPEKLWRRFFFPIRIMQCYVNRIIGVNFFIKKDIELARLFPFQDSEYVSCYGAGWGEKGKLEREVYLDRIRVNFENIKVWSIREYDEHLKRMYGDYMKLPPLYKRVTNHNYELYVDPDLLNELQ